MVALTQNQPPAEAPAAPARGEEERRSPLRAASPEVIGGRVPSLDGLRALSILLVVVSHARTTMGVPLELRRWVSAIPGNGPLGVSIFFVISGFLITHLLVREERTAGRIDVKGFYVRRAFRILPACYALLVAVWVLRHLGVLAVSWGNLWAAALFFTNYAPFGAAEWIGHTWSLSVEEQFYLLWPLLLLPLGRTGRIRLAAGLILLAPALCAASLLLLPPGHLLSRRIPVMLHTRADTLMFGCLAALLYPSPRFQRVVRGVFRARLHLAAFAFLFVVSPYLATWQGEAYLALGGYTLEGVCIVLLLVWAVQHPLGPVGRVLNSRPVVHLGVISYSLYLWQQLFLLESNHSWTGRFPLNLLCALAAAELSYWFVERTFLRLRDRLTGRRRYQTPVALSAGPRSAAADAVSAGIDRQDNRQGAEDAKKRSFFLASLAPRRSIPFPDRGRTHPAAAMGSWAKDAPTEKRRSVRGLQRTTEQRTERSGPRESPSSRRRNISPAQGVGVDDADAAGGEVADGHLDPAVAAGGAGGDDGAALHAYARQPPPLAARCAAGPRTGATRGSPEMFPRR